MKRTTFVALLLFPLLLQAGNSPQTIQWTGCGISKLGFMQDLAAAYKEKTGITIELSGGGATKGIREVAGGNAHLGGSCRLPLVTRAADGSLEVESSERRVKMIPIGWDALVVIVHKDNHLLQNITTDQIRQIYTGEITHWNQLGAPSDQPINLYIRGGYISGVGRTLRQQVFDNEQQPFSEQAIQLPSSGKIETALSSDPYGLAITGISSARHREGLRMVNLDGIEPNMENLEAGKYKLYRILFLTASPDYQQDPAQADFVRFALSPEGSRVIRSAGTLPFRYGMRLFTQLRNSYISNLDLIEASGLYSPSGS